MKSESPPRRNVVPVSHRFSRRAAAIGAALALAALPISATFTPAFAQPSPTPTTEASANTGANASAGADSDSGDDGGSAADGTNGADGGNANSEGGTDSGPAPGPTEDGDKACKDQEWTSDQPCAIKGKLTAKWQIGNQLAVPPNDQKIGSGTLPDSWVGKPFKAPKQAMKRIPAQSSDTHSGDSTTNDSDTDDSGQSVANATAQASAPTEYHFNDKGQIVAQGQSGPMDFKEFAPDGPNPAWTFEVKEVNGKNTIIATGEQYQDTDDGTGASDNKDGASSGTSTSGSDNGTDDKDPTASQDGSAKDGSKKADGSTSNADTSASADKDGVSGDGSSSSDKAASKDGTTPSDSASGSDADSKDSNSGNQDSKSENRNADTDSSGGTDSNGSGSGSESGDDDEKDSDKDGSGSSIGASDADGTTPDPSNGNGSPDDERETIPGNAGDEWLPGDNEDTETPDYSDPVPRNPDEPAPKDDTDLITGGDQPSPRANQNSATSFGESIISTIVSSWPVFVLAASGMAAVGFIIYLMGRRGKQD